MALYLGSEKVNINLNSVLYSLNLYSPNPVMNGDMLLLSDNCVLKDLNGLYLTAKKEDE